MTELRRSQAIVLALVCACLALPGCSGDEDLDSAPRAPATQATPGAAPEAPSAPESAATPESAAPSATGRPGVEERLRATIEVPDYYPEDGPVYPGAKPSQSQQMPNGKLSLMFGTDAPVEEASRVMIEASEAKGWEIVSTDEFDGGILTRAQKGGRDLMILTSRLTEDGQDAITLVAVNVEP